MKKKNKNFKCETCGKVSEDVCSRINAYYEEIYGGISYHTVCDFCALQNREDI